MFFSFEMAVYAEMADRPVRWPVAGFDLFLSPVSLMADTSSSALLIRRVMGMPIRTVVPSAAEL